jgi:hypothetical protein
VQAPAPHVISACEQLSASSQPSVQLPEPQPSASPVQAELALHATLHAWSAGQEIVAPSQLALPKQRTSHTNPSGQTSASFLQPFAAEQSIAHVPALQSPVHSAGHPWPVGVGSGRQVPAPPWLVVVVVAPPALPPAPPVLLVVAPVPPVSLVDEVLVVGVAPAPAAPVNWNSPKSIVQALAAPESASAPATTCHTSMFMLTSQRR